MTMIRNFDEGLDDVPETDVPDPPESQARRKGGRRKKPGAPGTYVARKPAPVPPPAWATDPSLLPRKPPGRA